LIAHDLGLSAIFFGCFTSSNLIGTMIWKKRAKVEPYRGLQFLMLFLFAGIALVCGDIWGLLDELVPSCDEPRIVYLVLLLYPAILVVFRRQKRAERHEDPAGGE